ncbi:hypothetical protein BDV28DRAFT_147148 [Aspergillus coremiiformis]|uniref:Uncharacterized protein n=1 Tax=Aspergillus coremiiformis TaxID=138285 RepID=A0A5N6Z9S8_9EURO|nr:hypothetical protein BDV28DRAFT_147148 [Aspergillus coremiiformis]
MRFFIPFTLLLATVALAAAPETDDTTADTIDISPEEVASCRPGYSQCMDSCRRHNGGQKCYRVCVAAPEI